MRSRWLMWMARTAAGLLLATTLVASGGARAATASLKAGVVGVALWSDQGVFLSEASRAVRLLAQRYGHGAPVKILNNTRRSFGAGPAGMAAALRSVSRSLDPERDVLFVVMSSHGSPQGIAEKGGGQEGLLSPRLLGEILATSKVRQKVLIVSACFAGIFTGLAGPDTLVITAADAEHPSFGCEAGATWTYFGDAFFNQALRKAEATQAPLNQVFADAAVLVRARETRQGFEPSNPQLAGGAHVLATLDGPR